MWNLDKIEIHDFFSHVDSVHEFKNNSCTLIVGENYDNGGNNGAGKSTIFEAIALALNNKTLRDLKKEDFINRDAESCMVKLSMSNSVIKSTLTISRKFFRGSRPVKVELIENGELNSTITSVDEANKRIYELIGVSREDLLRYFIIDQDNDYTFFTANDAAKKEVLNRITSADMINPLLEKLSNDRKSKEGERNEINNQLISIQSKKETLLEQIEELENSGEIADEIAELEEQIKRFKKNKKSNEESIEAFKERLTTLQAKFDKILIPDVTELINEKKALKIEKSKLENDKQEIKRIINLAEQDLDSTITCPHCKKEFIKDSNLELSPRDTKTAKKSAETEYTHIQNEINEIVKKISVIDEKLSEAEEKEEEGEKINRNIRNTKREITSLQDEISTLNKKISKRTTEIAELRERKQNDAAIMSLRDKIKECETKLTDLSSLSNKVDEELEMINYWNYYMGRSGFMTYLANKSVSVLSGTVNSFLKKFKSNLSVDINGFKVLRDGSVREKIEVFSLENGMNAEAFMSKSGGERGRINLAGVLAIQHLINMSCDGRGLNFLAMDETFHGVDSVGYEGMIKILESLGITVMLITQNVSTEFNNDNKLVVVKKDGVSKFVK